MSMEQYLVITGLFFNALLFLVCVVIVWLASYRFTTAMCYAAQVVWLNLRARKINEMTRLGKVVIIKYFMQKFISFWRGNVTQVKSEIFVWRRKGKWTIIDVRGDLKGWRTEERNNGDKS